MPFRSPAPPVAALLACLACMDTRAAEPARISAIEIRRGDIFTEEEAEQAYIPYGAANAFHMITRERFIVRELLFKVGDPLDPEALLQTERNLRATRLFRRVEVKPEGTRVVVETEDSWTFLPRGGFSRKGGLLTYQFGIQEKNLFGTGRELELKYDKGTERTARTIAFRDQQFLAPHISLAASYVSLSDGRSFDLVVARPFYALDVAAAGSAAFRDAILDAILYAAGVEASRWEKRTRFARLQGDRMLSHGETGALRLFAAAEWNETALAAGALGPPPPPTSSRKFLFAGLGVEREGRGWLKVRQVDQMDRDEDFNLAGSGFVELAASPNALGATAAGRVRAAGSIGLAHRSGFSLASAGGETRLDAGLRASRIAVDLRTYLQASGLTFVARVNGTLLDRPDPEDRLELDGLNGVRGYRLHAVSGTRRFVANFEARAFLVADLLHLVSLGTAVFLDEGFSEGPPDGFVHLTDVGIGLRVGLSRASTHTVVRFDLAKPLRPDPLGRRGWLFSFATGQAF